MASPIIIPPVLWHKMESATAPSEIGPNPTIRQPQPVAVSGNFGQGLYSEASTYADNSGVPTGTLQFDFSQIQLSKFCVSCWIKTGYSVDSGAQNPYNAGHNLWGLIAYGDSYDWHDISVGFDPWDGFIIVSRNPLWTEVPPWKPRVASLSWPSNTWKHFVVQFDKDYGLINNNCIEIWLDGAYVGGNNNWGDNLSAYSHQNMKFFTHSSRAGYSGTNLLAVDNLMVFDYNLNSTQIGYLYSNENWAGSQGLSSRRRHLSPQLVS